MPIEKYIKHLVKKFILNNWINKPSEEQMSHNGVPNGKIILMEEQMKRCYDKYKYKNIAQFIICAYNIMFKYVKKFNWEINKPLHPLEPNVIIQECLESGVIENDIDIKPIQNSELKYTNENTIFDMTKSYSYIQKKHYDNLDEIITFTKYKIKSSASESFIFTGVLKSNNMDVFCKFFTINKESLIYEKNIYNFINQFGEENMIFKETIIQHIVIPVDIIYTKKINLPIDLIPSNMDDYDDFDEISDDIIMCGIITQKYNSYTTIDDKIKQLSNSDLITLSLIKIDGVDTNINMNQYNIIKIIFSVLYSIYLLHMKLDVMHNDNHFGNILYYDMPEFTKVYKLGAQEIKSKENFTTRIYDFDQSSKIHQHSKYNSLDNVELDKDFCEEYGSCNRHTEKDVYMLIASLIRIYVKNRSQFLREIVICLINNNNRLISIIEKVQQQKLSHFWSSYLEMNGLQNNFINNSGNVASYPDLEITNVLNRFIRKYSSMNLLLIKDEHGNYMKFTDVNLNPIDDITYKKYLKYKKKYLNLKNIFNNNL